MTTRGYARAWFAFTAAVAAAALLVQLVLVLLGDDGGPVARVVRFLSYFTVESNILVAVVCALLARDPSRDSARWRVAHLDSVLCITVTGLVYVNVLRGTVELEGLALVTDFVFHTLVPVLALVGWVLFGPHGRWSLPVLRSALIFPVAYLVWTLVRGAAVGEYPYPFIDVAALGYPRALLNAVAVTALFAVLSGLLLLADRRLASARGIVPERA